MEKQKTIRRRPDTEAPAEALSLKDATFTSSELARILQEANSRQSSGEVNTIEEALETARELGIDEKHVLAAAREAQEKRQKEESLRKASRGKLNRIFRFAGTTVFVSAIVFVATDGNLGLVKLTASGMGIALVIMTFTWLHSLFQQRFPPDE